MQLQDHGKLPRNQDRPSHQLCPFTRQFLPAAIELHIEADLDAQLAKVALEHRSGLPRRRAVLQRVGTGSLLTDFHLAFDRYRSSPGTLARRMGGRAEARPALEELGSGDPVRGGCPRRVQSDYLNGSKSGFTILSGIVPVARNGFVPSAAGCRMASHD